MQQFLFLKRLVFNRLIVICHDILLIPIAWFCAYWLRFNLESIPREYLLQAVHTAYAVALLQTVGFLIVGSYRNMWGFASIYDIAKVIKAVLIGGVLLTIYFYWIDRATLTVPRSIIPLYIMLLTAMLSASRFSLRLIRDLIKQQSGANTKRVLIIGAGSAGEGLARDMLRTNTYKPVAFVDDKASRQGQEIHGIRVVGSSKAIPQIAKRFSVELIIFAIPSASSSSVVACGSPGCVA